MDLFTIGYEGKTIEEFVAELQQHGIHLLVDVRELPLSRKKGFSKSSIQAVLTEAGIVYVHLRALGTPPAMRKQLRETWNYESFFAEYRRRLNDHLDALERLIHLSQQQRVCLFCYEREPHRCHRSVLVQEMSQRIKVAVHHLT